MAGRNHINSDWTCIIPDSTVDSRIRKRHVDHIRIRYPEEIVVPSEPMWLEMSNSQGMH